MFQFLGFPAGSPPVMLTTASGRLGKRLVGPERKVLERIEGTTMMMMSDNLRFHPTALASVELCGEISASPSADP